MRPRPAVLVGISLGPLAVGLVVAWVLRQESVPDPLLQLGTEVSLGTVILIVGVLVSVIVIEGLGLWLLGRRSVARAMLAREQAAAEAHRRFLLRLDHEVKNPLTALYSNLETLSDLVGGRDPAGALISARKQARRIEDLLHALRRLAELEGRTIERQALAMEALLAEVAEAIAAECQRLDRTPDLVVDIAGDGTPTIVLGDRDLLWVLFFNLLDNALKFSARGNRIAFRSRTEGRWLVVEVANAGSRIPPEELGFIFEDLYRGSNARVVGGSGLGLGLARSIAGRHGGSIKVASLSETELVFQVRLPIAPA